METTTNGTLTVKVKFSGELSFSAMAGSAKDMRDTLIKMKEAACAKGDINFEVLSAPEGIPQDL